MSFISSVASSIESKIKFSSRFPGFFVSAIIAVAALKMGTLVPIIGAPVFAILFGIVFRHFVDLNEKLALGVAFTSKKVLQFAIVLLGAGLNIATIFYTGKQSFLVMIGTLLLALLGGHLIGKFMSVPTKMISLIAVGTGICGASAITSLSPIIEASENEMAYSISTVFFFNIVAVFLFPFFGHLFHFSDQAFGLWAGTAINDTSSVVAAGYSYSAKAGQYATIVKLTRSLMIIPVCFGYLMAKKLQEKRESIPKKKSVKFPMFILGFLVMSAINSFGWFGSHTGLMINYTGQFFMVIALAAIGLSTDLRQLMKTVARPLLMGLATWGLVAFSSLLLQKIIGQL